MPHPTDETARSRIRVGRIGGIQINLDYSWLFIFVLVLWSLSAGYFPQIYPQQTAQTYWIAGIVATFLFFSSILAHELCHSYVAIRSGIKIPEITLFIFGGVARLSEDARDPKTEFKIAVVGPLCSFALAAIFWGIQKLLQDNPSTIVPEIFRYLSWINVALAVFNLIPGLPLDGGRIFRAFWWWKTGSVLQATKLSSNVGQGVAFALMILGALQIFAGWLGGLWLIFIGMYLRGVAELSYQEISIRQSLAGTRARDIMIKDVVTAPSDFSINRLVSDCFLRYGYRGFPVTTNGKVLGIVSLPSIKGMPEEERINKTTRQIMTPIDQKMIITPDSSLVDALEKMSKENVRQLLVMRGDEMMGMVTQTGLLRFIEIKRAVELHG
jgi:Zn-dependent protease/predicted transcriptional regulator